MWPYWIKDKIFSMQQQREKLSFTNADLKLGHMPQKQKKDDLSILKTRWLCLNLKNNHFLELSQLAAPYIKLQQFNLIVA